MANNRKRIHVPWEQQKDGYYMVPCSQCPTVRPLSREACIDILKMRTKNICKRCSSLNAHERKGHKMASGVNVPATVPEYNGDRWRRLEPKAGSRQYTYQIQCTHPEHRSEYRWYTVEMTAYNRVRFGRRTGYCRSCSQIERFANNPMPMVPKTYQRKEHSDDEYVKIQCSCGTERYLLASTVKTYSVKGIEPKCLECQRSLIVQDTPQKYNKWKFQGEVIASLPCVPAPAWHRCHTVWEGESCELYDRCLTYACEHGWRGWVCSIPHDMTYCEEIFPRQEALEILEQYADLERGYWSDLGMMVMR